MSSSTVPLLKPARTPPPRSSIIRNSVLKSLLRRPTWTNSPTSILQAPFRYCHPTPIQGNQKMHLARGVTGRRIINGAIDKDPCLPGRIFFRAGALRAVAHFPLGCHMVSYGLVGAMGGIGRLQALRGGQGAEINSSSA